MGLSLACLEMLLRLFFGNFAVLELIQKQPGDGRCIGLKPNASVEYTGWLRRIPAVVQEVNASGYRGPLLPQARRSPAARVALLGDSFVYGVGVVNEETAASRLQALPRTGGGGIDFMNFGVPGLNLTEVSAQYHFFAKRWSPDIVLYFLGANDLKSPMCEDLFSHAAAPSGVIAVLNKSYTLRLVYMLSMIRSHASDDENALSSVPRLLDGLTSFAGAVAAEKSAFGLVILGNPLGRLSDDVKRWADRARVPVLDLSELWREKENRLAREGHPSARGHRLVAEAVAAWLEKDARFRAEPRLRTIHF